MISLINSHSPPLFRHKHVYSTVVRRRLLAYREACPRFTAQPASVFFFFFYLADTEAIISGIFFCERATVGGAQLW